MSTPVVKYYYINLDRSPDRRERCEAQAREFGIELERIPAVDGATLTESDFSQYDSNASLRELSRNEHACLKSHAKALRTFLDSQADYAVVMEDDITFYPHTKGYVEHIVHHTRGWECVRLYTNDSRLYTVMPRNSSAPCELTFPRKVLWGAVANLYSRKAAEVMLKAVEHYDQAWDSLVGCTMLAQGIPMCAVFPNALTTWDPNNKASVIDNAGAPARTEQKAKAGLGRYLRRRFHVWKVALDKLRMRRILKKSLKTK